MLIFERCNLTEGINEYLGYKGLPVNADSITEAADAINSGLFKRNGKGEWGIYLDKNCRFLQVPRRGDTIVFFERDKNV